MSSLVLALDRYAKRQSRNHSTSWLDFLALLYLLSLEALFAKIRGLMSSSAALMPQ